MVKYDIYKSAYVSKWSIFDPQPERKASASAVPKMGTVEKG
jgi:hypothetical protein